MKALKIIYEKKKKKIPLIPTLFILNWSIQMSPFCLFSSLIGEQHSLSACATKNLTAGDAG